MTRLKTPPNAQRNWERKAAEMRTDIQARDESAAKITEADLIARGWRKIGDDWLKTGAIICQRGNRKGRGVTFDDARKLEALIDQWGEE
jgi:hypothetical protein